MKLSNRLNLVAKKIIFDKYIYDIGTDHAHIPIYAIQNNLCEKAFALDVKIGPINVAKKNIKKYNLEDKIETLMGSGLCPIDIKEYLPSTIVIAGMGGILISEILEESIKVSRNSNYLILQPMNSDEILRKWLSDNKFEIIDEELALEGDKVYLVIVAKYANVIKEIDDYFIGDLLIKKKDKNFKKYIEKKIRILNKMINGIKESKDFKEESIYGIMDEKVKLEKIFQSCN